MSYLFKLLYNKFCRSTVWVHIPIIVYLVNCLSTATEDCLLETNEERGGIAVELFSLPRPGSITSPLGSGMTSREHVRVLQTPYTPLAYSKTGVYRGIHYFSYLCSKP